MSSSECQNKVEVKVMGQDYKDQDKGVENETLKKQQAPKPPLIRSQSLSSPLNPNFNPIHSATSNIHLHGSAKSQRLNSGQKDFRKASLSRLSSSSSSSPSSPNSTIHYSYKDVNSGSSISGSNSHDQSINNDTNNIKNFSKYSSLNKNRYKDQEKAYIKKMNDDYIDDYATMKIDTVEDKLDDMEYESDGYDYGYGFDDSELEDDVELSNSLSRTQSTPLSNYKESASISPMGTSAMISNLNLSNSNNSNNVNINNINYISNNNNFINDNLINNNSSSSISSISNINSPNVSVKKYTNAASGTGNNTTSNSSSRNNSNIINNDDNSNNSLFTPGVMESTKIHGHGSPDIGFLQSPISRYNLQNRVVPLRTGSNSNISTRTSELRQSLSINPQSLDIENYPFLSDNNKSDSAVNLDATDSNDEYQQIFGEIDADEEDDNNVTYATELTRIAPDKLNDTFQIDDNVMYPLIKPKLTPELVHDPKFLEKFEWQLMLGVVVKSDIVTTEKNRMIRRLNFGNDQENSKFVNAHGNEQYLSTFFLSRYKEDLWLAVMAWKYGRTIEDQEKVLAYERSLMDEVVDEIQKFKYDGSKIAEAFYAEVGTDQLTYQQQHYLEALLFEDCNKVIQDLLDKYESCEELWITEVAMYEAKPHLKSKEFRKTLEALISWKNIVNALYLEKAILIKSSLNDNPVALDDISGDDGSLDDESGSEYYYEDNVSEGESDDTYCNDFSFPHHLGKFSEISELDPVLFAENMLKFKDMATILDNKILKVINPWSKKSKETYLRYKESFSKMNLPSFLNILLDLVTFPSKSIKEVIKIRLLYARNMKHQTMMSIDQTIRDFKVIIRLSFQIKEDLLKFLTKIPDLKSMNVDFEDFDRQVLEFIEYLLVLFHRKTLDSAKSAHSFTTYKEPEFLKSEWTFLKNVGHFLDCNAGFKISRSFLFLVSRLVVRLVNYLDYNLRLESVQSQTQLINWYRSSLDIFNNLRRHFTKLINYMLRSVQNGLVLHLNLKDPEMSKIWGSFLRKRKHYLISINKSTNLYDLLYNKGNPSSYNNNDNAENTSGPHSKRKQRKQIFVYVFVSEELAHKTDKDIIEVLHAKKLGCDSTKPVVETLFVDETESTGLKPDSGLIPSGISTSAASRVNDVKKQNMPGFDYDSDSSSEYSKKASVADNDIAKNDDDTSAANDNSTGTARKERIGYMIIIPMSKPVQWDGRIRNIEINEEEIHEFPKLLSTPLGNAFLLSPGSPYDLYISKTNLIFSLKCFYVSEYASDADLLNENIGAKNSVDYAVKLFDSLTVDDKEKKASSPAETLNNNSSDRGTKNTGEPRIGAAQKLEHLIKNMKTERICSLVQIQNEFARINRNYNDISFVLLEKGLKLKDDILQKMTKSEIQSGFLEVIISLFNVIRDSSLETLHNIEPSRRKLFVEYMIKLSTEWIAVIIEDCVSTDTKTFKWCLSALEFVSIMFQNFNVLLLNEEQFQILKTKVSDCLSLLVSHFDIMGARSIKASKELLDASKLQRNELQKDRTIAEMKNNQLKQEIIDLEAQLSEKSKLFKTSGRILDKNYLENRFLVYLSKKYTGYSAKWQKGEKVGSGAFGSVYRATDLTNGIVMAVKEVKFNQKGQKKIRTVIEKEIQALERLSHPNVVDYYGLEVHSDRVYLFLEFCGSGTLANLLEHGRIEDELIIKGYTFQMVEGLAYLHQNGVEHRDIKPENILLNRVGVVKFIDFGTARIEPKVMGDDSIYSSGSQRANSSSSTKSQMEKSGLNGTPMYMSPESLESKKAVPFGSCDIWSLGCCVLEMATGRTPWSKVDNEFAIMFRITQGKKPNLPTEQELSKTGIEFISQCFLPYAHRPSAVNLLHGEWLFMMLEDDENGFPEYEN